MNLITKSILATNYFTDLECCTNYKSPMALIKWKILPFLRFIVKSFWFYFNTTKLTIISLFYNDFADWYYVGDTCMEPMLWFVDHFTKILGPICVAGVLILSSSVIVITYIIGLPYYIRWNGYMLALALIVGHWLLLIVVFYYYMAYTTEPGYPPQGAMITEAVSICKRCIAPKPPRTHHCIVCNRCILKMDHHCPWLNNCIGHFNHRYFFMFCVYAWAGVMFIMWFGIPVAYDHFFGNAEHSEIHPVLIDFAQNIAKHIFFKTHTPQESQVQNQNITLNSETVTTNWSQTLYHSCIIYCSLLCMAVFFVLGGLIAWHARLISRGETSIESHINKKEKARLAKENQVYKNPYDFGPVKNWKIFLCIGDKSDTLSKPLTIVFRLQFRNYCSSSVWSSRKENTKISKPWWHLLIPFAEKPEGDGLTWQFLSQYEDDDDKDSKKDASRTCSVKIS